MLTKLTDQKDAFQTSQFEVRSDPLVANQEGTRSRRSCFFFLNAPISPWTPKRENDLAQALACQQGGITFPLGSKGRFYECHLVPGFCESPSSRHSYPSSHPAFWPTYLKGEGDGRSPNSIYTLHRENGTTNGIPKISPPSPNSILRVGIVAPNSSLSQAPETWGSKSCAWSS